MVLRNVGECWVVSVVFEGGAMCWSMCWSVLVSVGVSVGVGYGVGELPRALSTSGLPSLRPWLLSFKILETPTLFSLFCCLRVPAFLPAPG